MSPPPLIPVDEVVERLLADATPIDETEMLGLSKCTGRVLADDIVSPRDVPASPNSSMDGYAVNTQDPAYGADVSLPVSDRIPAGHVGQPLAAGTVARIFTGAPLPAGADAVVIQEDTEAHGDSVRINVAAAPGENVRPAGQDIQRGITLLKKGRRLRPQDLAVAASVGIASLPVFRRLRVALLSTGDELVDPPGELHPGQIYNSNHYALIGLVQQLDMDVVDIGLVRDDLDATVKALAAAAEQADVIISSGGVSVGEEDHVKAALEQLGALDMWRIAIKPGKPLAFGRVGHTPFFGLPGNPVSTYVTFTMIAATWLKKRQGISEPQPRHFWAEADFEMPAGSRREYVRVRIETGSEGKTKAVLYPEQGSGVMSSVSWANALAEVDIGQQVSYGDRLKIFLLKD